MNAALVLEAAVDPAAADERDDFLEPAETAAAQTEHLELPAPALGVAAVHAKELRSEERGFLPSRSGADLEDDVPFVVRVLGKQEGAQVRFEAIAAGLKLQKLLPRHHLHLLVLEQGLRFTDLPQDLPVLPGLEDDLLELGVALGALTVALGVGHHGRVGQLMGEL